MPFAACTRAPPPKFGAVETAMPKTKFFRVAVEGATATDGRVITRQMISEMVSGFNRATFGPRINMEHIRGYSAEPPFNAYGDVLSLKEEEVDLVIDTKTERRLGLYAEIDPTPELVEINKKRQKIFTSIEVTPNFANTNKFGLVGLAVTDNPASLGTEALQFSALKPMFDARKTAPENFFSASIETSFEVEALTPDNGGIAAAIQSGFASVAAMFTRTEPEKPKEEPKTPANDNGFDVAAFTGAMGTQVASAIDAKLGPVMAAFTALQGEFASLKGDIEKTPQSFTPRTPATGGSGTLATDC